jgi:hypothetical protein
LLTVSNCLSLSVSDHQKAILIQPHFDRIESARPLHGERNLADGPFQEVGKDRILNRAEVLGAAPRDQKFVETVPGNLSSGRNEPENTLWRGRRRPIRWVTRWFSSQWQARGSGGIATGFLQGLPGYRHFQAVSLRALSKIHRYHGAHMVPIRQTDRNRKTTEYLTKLLV